MGRDDQTTPSSLPIHIRIRKRREDRGLSGVDLAERAGVSPSYVSLIEKGVKIPDEDVAVAIAKALGDDEELYRSWARAKRYGDDLEVASADLVRAYRYSSDRKLRQRISRGEDMAEAPLAEAPPAAARARRPIDFARRLFSREAASVSESVGAPREGESLLHVPVFPAGVDPGIGPGSEAWAPERSLHLDPCLLETKPLGVPYAFRADARTISRVADEIRPGDWIVVDLGVRSVDPEAIHAVRLRGSVVLSRVGFSPKAILLPPGPGRSDVEVIDLAEGEEPSRHLVGRVVAVIRAKI